MQRQDHRRGGVSAVKGSNMKRCSQDNDVLLAPHLKLWQRINGYILNPCKHDRIIGSDSIRTKRFNTFGPFKGTTMMVPRLSVGKDTSISVVLVQLASFIVSVHHFRSMFADKNLWTCMAQDIWISSMVSCVKVHSLPLP